MEKEEEERREEGRAECWRKEGDGRGLMCRISISQKWPFRFARVQIRGQMRNMLGFFLGGEMAGWPISVYQDVCIIRYTRDPESL